MLARFKSPNTNNMQHAIHTLCNKVNMVQGGYLHLEMVALDRSLDYGRAHNVEAHRPELGQKKDHQFTIYPCF